MLDVQVQNFSLTEAMKTHLENKLEPMNNNFGDRILSTHAHLSDVNGPKGGESKKCLLRIELQKLPSVVVEDTQENLYTAIDNCCNSAERAVRKSLERQQTLARKQAPAI